MRNTKWESRRWVWVLVKTPWKTSWEDSIWNFSLQTISNVCKIRMIKRIPTNLDSLLKSRDITLPTKGHLVKAMVFPVVTWELNYKESWVLKNWCFWTVVLEKTLERPLDNKEIQLVHPKGNQSWIFIGKTDAEAETQEPHVQSLDPEDPLEKGMATHSSILAWRISWTEEPGELQSMSQRVGYNWSNLACTQQPALPEPELKKWQSMSHQ